MILDLSQPRKLLGQQADSAEIIEVLSEIGHTGLVNIKRGETDVYISSKSMGISMLFESESYAHSQYGVSLPSEAPILVAIFVYGSDHPEFSQYQGDLYGGIQFSDSQKVARNKLGAAIKFSEKFNSESWDLPNKIGLIADYSKSRDKILSIQFGIEL